MAAPLPPPGGAGAGAGMGVSAGAGGVGAPPPPPQVEDKVLHHPLPQAAAPEAPIFWHNW